MTLRQTSELTLAIPALARPIIPEIQKTFEKWGRVNNIERDCSPTDSVTLVLGTVLKSGEKSITGSEYERRLKPNLNLMLGFQHAAWLVENQGQLPAFNALPKVYIDFPGLIITRPDGKRHLLHLTRRGDPWEFSWAPPNLDFHPDGRIALSNI